MVGPTLQQAGIPLITIDGTDLAIFPDSLSPSRTLAQTRFATADAKGKMFGTYRGPGYSDLIDTFEFALPFSGLSDDQGVTLEFLEKVGRQGGLHTLALWKREYDRYTAYAGQTFFYTLRKNAPTNLAKSTTDYPWTVKINTVPISVANTIYSTTVTATTTVAAGKVDVSQTTGAFKLGTALALNDIVEVEYYPMFQVAVQDASTQYTKAGVEPRTMIFVESNDPNV